MLTEADSILLSSSTIEHSQDKRCLLVTAPPPEIHNLIFQLLDPVTSTCLGITCKTFYGIHRSFHGSVSLATGSSINNRDVSLHELLENWVCQGLPLRQQISLVYSPIANKFQDIENITHIFEIDRKKAERRLDELRRAASVIIKSTNADMRTHLASVIVMPQRIVQLLAQCDKAMDDVTLAKDQRKLLWSSFEFSVLRVEAKAAVSCLILGRQVTNLFIIATWTGLG
jgi:hypothetical protein